MDAKALARLRRIEPVAKRKPAIKTIPQPQRQSYQDSVQHEIRLHELYLDIQKEVGDEDTR